MDGSFDVHEWCLYHSDILLSFFEGKLFKILYCVCVCFELIFEYLKAQENFEDEANRKFNLKKFRKMSIRKVFDSLHGITDKSIPLSNAVEIMAYCLVDGKVDQDSEFETDLYNELVEQLREMKAGFMMN